MPTLPTRGGARQRTKPQPNNTSGLLGIRFRWKHKTKRRLTHWWPEVEAAIGRRRISRGLLKRTPRQALRDVIRARRDAGLAVPTLREALEAFERWVDANEGP